MEVAIQTTPQSNPRTSKQIPLFYCLEAERPCPSTPGAPTSSYLPTLVRSRQVSMGMRLLATAAPVQLSRLHTSHNLQRVCVWNTLVRKEAFPRALHQVVPRAREETIRSWDWETRKSNHKSYPRVPTRGLCFSSYHTHIYVASARHTYYTSHAT